MPRAIARDKNGILYTTDPETNQWRALNNEEHGSLSPVGVLDEFGPGPIHQPGADEGGRPRAPFAGHQNRSEQ